MNNEEEKIFLNNLLKAGLLNLENKKPKIAIEIFEKILFYRPKNPQVLNLSCIVYHQLGDLNKALSNIKKAIQYNSNEIGFHINLGNILKDLKDYSSSKQAYNKALKINEKSVETLYNLGVMHTAQHQYTEAKFYYEKAITFDPTHKYAFDNLGTAYAELGKFDQSINCYNKAINIDPNFNQAHYNLSFVFLLTNSLKLGWEKYEYRLKKDNYTINQPFLNYNYWDGSNLQNKSLLIYCEQGIGDNIMFARYIKKIKKNNTKIILFCKKNLIIFFKYLSEIDLIITSNQDVPKIDYYVSLMSLPYIFRNDKNVPEPYNFIKPDKELTLYWKSKIHTSRKIKVGLVWQGDRIHYDSDYKRSIPLKKFKSLIELHDIEYISLQKDSGKEQIQSNRFEKKISDFFDNIDQTPFKDTLSIIENLDLIISVDTAIAHISATLNKETWVLLPYIPHYVWGLDKSETHWYNNVKLFRQKKINQWDQVILEVRNALIEKFNLK